MNISPINFKRVEPLKPMNFTDTLANAYASGIEQVTVSSNKITENKPMLDEKKVSEFDNKGNMKSCTIYKNSCPDKQYFYYPETQRASAAIEYITQKPLYPYSKVKEVSIFNRHGEETHNFNYIEGKAKIRGEECKFSKDGQWNYVNKKV